MNHFLLSAAIALTLAVVAGGGFETRSANAAPVTQNTPVTFRGAANGRDTRHTVDLRPGLVVVRARHAGSSNFILELILPRPGADIQWEYEEAVFLINDIGQYNGGAAGRVNKGGTYVLNIDASGSYEITVEQPPLSQAAAPGQLEFSGKGQQVTPVVTIPAGRRRITLTHDGHASYGPHGLVQVFFYDMDGNTVSGEFGRLFNEFGPFSGAVDLEIILDGPHLFHVLATGSWTLRIE